MPKTHDEGKEEGKGRKGPWIKGYRHVILVKNLRGGFHNREAGHIVQWGHLFEAQRVQKDLDLYLRDIGVFSCHVFTMSPTRLNGRGACNGSP